MNSHRTCEHSFRYSAARGGRPSWPPSRKCDVTSEIRLRQTMRVYLKNNRAKFHRDPCWKDEALNFLKRVAQKEQRKQRQQQERWVLTDMGGAPGSMAARSSLPHTRDKQSFKSLPLVTFILFENRQKTVFFVQDPAGALHLDPVIGSRSALVTVRRRRRRRQRVVVEDRSVTPEWPLVVDLLHRSAGGVLLLSLRSWWIHRLFGRPGRRFQLWSGRWPRVRSTWHRSAWWAGVSSGSLAMWPKTEFRWRVMRSDTGARPVRAATSEFLMWSWLFFSFSTN